MSKDFTGLDEQRQHRSVGSRDGNGDRSWALGHRGSCGPRWGGVETAGPETEPAVPQPLVDREEDEQDEQRRKVPWTTPRTNRAPTRLMVIATKGAPGGHLPTGTRMPILGYTDGLISPSPQRDDSGASADDSAPIWRDAPQKSNLETGSVDRGCETVGLRQANPHPPAQAQVIRCPHAGEAHRAAEMTRDVRAPH